MTIVFVTLWGGLLRTILFVTLWGGLLRTIVFVTLWGWITQDYRICNAVGVDYSGL